MADLSAQTEAERAEHAPRQPEPPGIDVASLLCQGATAYDLQRMEFPPVVWAVPGILPTGLNLLVGPPKSGKSYLALHMACAVANGTRVFGTRETGKPGLVLYIDLEQDGSLIQDRMKQSSAPGDEWPKNLHFLWDFPRFDEGGLEALRELVTRPAWGTDGARVRLVIIDVWEHVRQRTGAKEGNAYRQDTLDMKPVADLAKELGITLLLLHHTRKVARGAAAAGDDNPFERISGSNGIYGQADSAAVIERGEGADCYTLHIQGRRVPMASLALKMTDGRWIEEGPGALNDHGGNRRAILAAVLAGAKTLPQISEESGVGSQVCKNELAKLVRGGDVVRCGRGQYSIPRNGAPKLLRLPMDESVN